MLFRAQTPRPLIARFVERFWECSDVPAHQRERILPSGTFELVFNLREDEIRIYNPLTSDYRRFSGAVVSGPYSGCFLIDPLQHAAMMGVHFRPGGAKPFLRIPSHELADAHANLDVFWGKAAQELRERLCAANCCRQRFTILEDALVTRLSDSFQAHSAVAVALEMIDRTGGAARTRDMANRVDLSQRRFIQLFSTEVGLTPKLFSRIRRFEHVRKIVENVHQSDWALVAARCGYADQSHLIRDFHEFSGLSPVNYLRRDTTQVLPNHVPQAC